MVTSQTNKPCSNYRGNRPTGHKTHGYTLDCTVAIRLLVV